MFVHTVKVSMLQICCVLTEAKHVITSIRVVDCSTRVYYKHCPIQRPQHIGFLFLLPMEQCEPLPFCCFDKVL